MMGNFSVQHDPRLHERLSAIEVTLEHMDRRLFGNGQPGELERLAMRVSQLETHSWKIAGAMGLALFVLNFLTGSGLLSAARLFGAVTK